MKRTISILVIMAMVFAVSGLASATAWYRTDADPNALVPWEEGTNWYPGNDPNVMPGSADTAQIEYQLAWLDPIVSGQYAAICYLNSPTTVLQTLIGVNAESGVPRPGKLQVGPAGVLTNTGAFGLAWNGTDRAGTLINEGTINVGTNLCFTRKGDGIVKLLGDSLIQVNGTAGGFLCQYSGTLDLYMAGNAAVEMGAAELRNQRLGGPELQINMHGNSYIETAPVNCYMYSFGDSSMNDNSYINWNGRMNNNVAFTGTLDINDSAVMNFAGSHGGCAGDTINVNGGTLMTSNANIYGIRDAVAINVSGGALLCTTAAARAIANNTITLSGTGVINGWSEINGGSLTMTGGKLGCTTNANVGDVTNSGGAISPNLGGIAGITIGAGLTQSSTASLEIDLDGSAPGESDVVTVTGAAVLDGTLDINVNYVPTDGDSFQVLTAGGGITGTFTNLDPTSYVTSGGYPFWVAVGANSVTMTYVADGNAAPAADAGPDVVIDDPNDTAQTTSLVGSYIDDGRPVPPTYTQTWTQVSGDAAIIVSPNALTTDVTVPGWGTYVFQLEVSDSLESGTDTVAVQSKEPPIIPVGPLVAWYTFDTDLSDSSVNEFDLILAGASVGGAANADAIIGAGSLYLGGGTSAIRDGQDLLVKTAGRATAVTVAYWTKKAGEPDAWCAIFSNGNVTEEDEDYGFILLRPDASRVKWQCAGTTTDTNPWLQYNNGVDNNGDTVVDPDMEDGAWHHVACVYDSVAELTKFYVDGVKQLELNQYGPLIAPVSPAIVLGGEGNDDDFWKGLMDDFRVYDMALDDGQIAGLTCPGNLNGDTVVALDDITEIVLLIKDAPGYSIASTGNETFDLNGDGFIALDDITEIVLMIKDAPGYSVACP